MNTIFLKPATITSWEFIELDDAPKPRYGNKYHFLHFDREVVMECLLISKLVNTVLPKCSAELGVLFYNFHRARLCEQLHNTQHVHIAISQRRGWFQRPLSYLKLQHLSYTKMKRVLDYLENNGFIKVIPGYWNFKYSHGLRTLVLPLPKLFSTLYGSPRSIRLKIPKRTGRLVLKDKNKIPIKIDSNKKTSRLTRNLSLINTSNARHQFNVVSLQSFPLVGSLWVFLISFSKIAGYRLRYDRIFNTSLTKGGRFYCRLQNITKDQRKNIFIDGQPTVELDYKSLHPRIAYHQISQDLTTDPYVIGINGTREIGKQAFLILLNSKNRNNAVKALRDSLIEENIPIPANLCLKSFLKTLEQQHQPISNFFYKCIALDFQWIDSQIAEGVLLKFASLEKPCFAIHDSFVVKQEDEALLKQTMIDEYQKVVKTPYLPAIKKV